LQQREPTEIVDCAYVITKATDVFGQALSATKIPAELVAACAPVEATRRAAKVAARVTTNAAVIQLGAGLFIIAGGALTYLAAVRQSYLEETQANLTRLALAKRLVFAATQVRDWSGRQLELSARQSQGVQRDPEKAIALIPQPLVRELEPSRWGDHARLGEGPEDIDVVGSIVRLEASLHRFNEFALEVQEQKLTPFGSKSRFAMILGVFDPGGEERLDWEDPIVTCQTLAADVETASNFLLDDLNKLIAASVRRSRFRDLFSKRALP
jgi:hypothetical protein